MQSNRSILPPPAAPEDEQGEMILPKELAILAEGLSRQADELEARYPSQRPLVERPAPPDGGFLRWTLTTAGAALALCLCVGSVAVWQAPMGAPSAMDQPAMSDNVNVVRSLRGNNSSPKEATPASSPPSPSAVIFVEQASGPELEGLLDVMDDEVTGAQTLSL